MYSQRNRKIINEHLAQQKRLPMNRATENIVYEDRLQCSMRCGNTCDTFISCKESSGISMRPGIYAKKKDCDVQS